MSAAKTVCVLFANDGRLKTQMKPIVVNNTAIKVEKAAKFLGVVFDERLTWKQHFDHVISKCKTRLNLMRSITGTTWGASKASLLLIYRALIRSVLEYGAIAFDSATDAQKRRLDAIQYQALRIATGAMTSTSLAALQIETGEPPLQIRRLEQQIKYAAKVTSTPGHPSASVVTTDWKVDRGRYKPGAEPMVTKIADFVNKCPAVCNAPALHTRPPWTMRQPKIDTRLADQICKKDAEVVIKSAAMEKIDSYKHHLHIYTDGSKTERGVVAAAFRVPEIDEGHAVRLNDDVTIYAAEMTALAMALLWLQSANTQRPAAIFSDSLSSLQSLRSGKSRSRPNLQAALIELYDVISNDVTLVWVPGHSGLRHNDEVDLLAKAATHNSSVDFHIGYEVQDVAIMAEQYCAARWQQQWSADTKGRHLHSIQPNVPKTAMHGYSSRRKETTIARLRLGKCRLNSYMHVLQCHDSGLCATCNVPETIEHFVVECAYSKPRNTLLQYCNKNNVALSVRTVLTDETMTDILYRSLDRVL